MRLIFQVIAVHRPKHQYDILHVSILCSTFLAYAREAQRRGRMSKRWRWSIFDRPLARYYNGWVLSRPSEIDEFNAEFGERWYAPNKEILDESKSLGLLYLL